MTNSLLILTLLPLLGALLILFVPKGSNGAVRGIAFLATLLPLILALILWSQYDTTATGMQFTSSFDWIHIPHAYADQSGDHTLTVSLLMGVDGLSLPIVILTAVISFLAVIASWKIEYRIKSYFFWYLLLITGLFGVFTSLDAFAFFFFLELTLVPVYFLINIWGGERRQHTATKFVVYRAIASIGILISFIGLAYMAAIGGTGEISTNFVTIGTVLKTAANVPLALKYGLFMILFIAVLIEEAFFPFHTWLPDTHASANPALSMVIGGVLMKIGAYVLIRIGVGILPDALAHYATLIAVLGVINILYGALVAMVQKDWKRLVAFSTISHMGIVLLGIAAHNSAGIQGAIFMIVSSGLLSGLLFFVLGAVQDRTQTTQIHELGGLSKSMPILSGVWLAASLGSLGLPGMSGFISEITSFIGGFAIFPVLSAFGTLGLILAAVYLLWAMQRTTFGPSRGIWQGLDDVRAIEYIPIFVFLACIILIGVYPAVLGDVVNQTVQTFVTRIGG
ncbi:NADH-quinone oxidoreductase subunit M [Fodinisporobacter ferrooxydans]|uniref:NADH-quinone oxidoreductase subunit M n=1 Tax=Fodinisporobacter ferrooxydans TaxID=2901836 RepID=A0ABY4CM45_9BACL|nr:NADH-quinone oxidoreductase subunit M [Alicyclobacillaceae bacterium MYW30-H2]